MKKATAKRLNKRKTRRYLSYGFYPSAPRKFQNLYFIFKKQPFQRLFKIRMSPYIYSGKRADIRIKFAQADFFKRFFCIIAPGIFYAPVYTVGKIHKFISRNAEIQRRIFKTALLEKSCKRKKRFLKSRIPGAFLPVQTGFLPFFLIANVTAGADGFFCAQCVKQSLTAA